MRPLLSLSADELSAWLAEQGQPAYRAKQIRHWIFGRRVREFAEMTDLSKGLRTALAEEFTLWTSRVAAHQKAGDGSEKLLLELSDGERVECVLLRAADGHRTICLSTQVGCAMGCVFCASGLDGVVRNLTTAEMIEELLLVDRLLGDQERLSHIVVMGMGESLANLRNLLPALEVATSELGIGTRRITISTVGMPEKIRELADLDVSYHLAVSLHAPSDELRTQLVPVNKNVGLEPILEAADYFFHTTGRRVTYEYVLLAGINDQPEHARQLAELLRHRKALVNAIPYNPVEGLGYRTPSRAAVARFEQILREAGIAMQVRHRKGDQIDAACGQLRRNRAGDLLQPQP